MDHQDDIVVDDGTAPLGDAGSAVSPCLPAPARIAAVLGRTILAGDLRPGDAVPGEMDLGLRFDAGRSVVREALKILAAKGLIETRRRSGTRVRPRARWALLDADVLAWRLSAGGGETKFADDLMHARAVIEPAAAAMAAIAHTPSTLAAIEAAFAEMERCANDRAAFAAPDIAFHEAILAATGNDVMMALGPTIEAALGVFLPISYRHAGAPAPSVPLHGAVLAAIARRDAEGARAAMMALLDHTAANVRRNTDDAGQHA